ncbi:sugar phosphate isomerase/epimerase family protein [Saliterribacillus persicus]|uniref:Sugar phosphate isomerase/epimerase n=1 Tax=Saliterribacillus persicus TaxID=930114 RepID=A0A368Y383_9BACI|nr:TIM barrel protein [Saliterribacillus persicus]RCW74760.1 sugar phosphate isomerase/epimerase [Saliterribacillus persicus]
MKLGLCSVTFREKSVEQVIDLAMQAELEGIEWGADVHVPPNDLTNAKEVHKLTESRGMKVSSYGSYYRVGDHSENDFTFKEILQAAEALKAPAIRVWAGVKGSDEADKTYRSNVIKDAKKIGEEAKKAGISIHFEYHGGTLTDTKESAAALMQEVNHANVFLYWQPAVGLSVEERLRSIAVVKPWITNVHVFHWTPEKRLELGAGAREWQNYLTEIMKDHKDRYVMMEFVKDNNVNQFYQDAKTLHQLKEMIEGDSY